MFTSHTNRFRVSAVAVASVVALSGGFIAACNPAPSGEPTPTTMHHGHQSAQVALHSAMRSLWADHMQWTYDTIVAFASGSESLEPTMARLLRNQEDIGNAVKPFYGEEAGDALTALLKEHINDAVPVLVAAKNGDADALNAAVEEWNRNAREIGDFLADANPDNWDRASMEEMMEGHIAQTVAYAADQLAGNYAGSIHKFDQANAHMAEMADMLSDGIIKQFPDRF